MVFKELLKTFNDNVNLSTFSYNAPLLFQKKNELSDFI